MSSSQPPASESPGASPGCVAFAEAWGVLARTLAFYPDANERVRRSTEAALEAFQSALAETGGEVAVLVSRTEVLAGAGRAPLLERSNLSWLLERLERCRLAGAVFGPELQAEGLVRFSRQLLEGYRRTQLDPEFEGLLAEVPAGVRPVEQRFEGVFRGGEGEPAVSWLDALLAPDAAARADPLALLAARDPRVRESLQRLVDRPELASLAAGSGVKAADLLGVIVRSLPAEATHREEDLVRYTLEVLEALGDDPHGTRRAAAGSELGRSLEESLLGQALADVSRRVFAREGLASEEVVQRQLAGGTPARITPAMRGHAHDERIADDLDALLGEVEALPSPRLADLDLSRAEDQVEQLGVLLHFLTTLESDEEAALARKPAARCVREGGAAEREVLELYLGVLRQESAEPTVLQHQRRLREFLREGGFTQLLAEFEGLSPATVVDLFPSRFGEWLDSLDVADLEHRARLLEVCDQLGPERIRSAAAQLEGAEDLGQPGRSRKLLAVRDPAVAPLVRVLLTRASVATRREVVRFLEATAVGREEACLLGLADAADLPRRYLADLLDPPAREDERELARRLVADTLAELVERWAEDPRCARRRLDAVRLLGRFRSRHAADVLRQLARRSKLFPSAVEADLQRAAREALRAYP